MESIVNHQLLEAILASELRRGTRLAPLRQGRADRSGIAPDHLLPARRDRGMNLLLGLPFVLVVWALLVPVLFLDGGAGYL